MKTLVSNALFTFLVCSLLVACSGGGGGSSATPAAQPVKNTKPNTSGMLVVFGDSLAAGYGAKQESSKLANCLGATLKWSSWRPYGVVGATSADGVQYVDDLLKLNPKIVVVSLGGNDVLQTAAGYPFPAEETFKNLRVIYKKLTDRGILVVHLGLAPPINGAERLPAIKDVADSEGVLFVPDAFSGLWDNPEFMSDQIHPNDKGYRKVCAKLADAMRPYL